MREENFFFFLNAIENPQGQKNDGINVEYDSTVGKISLSVFWIGEKVLSIIIKNKKKKKKKKKNLQASNTRADPVWVTKIPSSVNLFSAFSKKAFEYKSKQVPLHLWKNNKNNNYKITIWFRFR